jgi:hypothetical protein
VSQATGNASTPFRTTTATYNAAGKPLMVTNPDGTTTTAAYDTVLWTTPHPDLPVLGACDG